MKRSISIALLLIVLLGVMAASSATAAGNTFPFPNRMSGLYNGVGDDEIGLPLQQGWYQGRLAWYVPVIGSVIRPVGFQIIPNLDLDRRFRYYKLTSAIGHGAALMYVVINYVQGPVFTTIPGNADYSGLWQVVYVTWKPGVTPRPIIDAANLPTAAEADFATTDIVVDRPIVATGRLDGPWFPAPPGEYRLKQVIDYDLYAKIIRLPVWFVYSQDVDTKQPLFGEVIIPDVADPALAELLQANYAPALADVDPDNTQPFWVQDWKKQPPPPPFQLPITLWGDNIEVPGPLGYVLKRNPQFTPIMDLILLERTGLPAYVVVNNPTYLQYLIAQGAFVVEGTLGRINAPMVESVELRMLLGGSRW